MVTFQEIVRRLSKFWEEQGCIIHQGYDLEAGAGTFNPATFLRCLGPEPYRAAYIEPCRRPSDGRYGENPNRLQHYFQYQVIIKPSPFDIQQTYLNSLKTIGFDLDKHDIRFVHDDWENPTIGAWGLGWEVWCDGMEVTQFTYFQSVGGVSLDPVTVELTYGIERLAMYIQGVDSIFDLQWNDQLTYGDIYHRSEVEWSHYNFENASTEMWFRHFEDYEKEAKQLMEKGLPIPAYDFIMKASHAFNLLDARGVISVTERTGYIGRIRDLAKLIAESYSKSREDLAFPLMGRFAKKREEAGALPSLSDHLKCGNPEEKEDFLFEIGSEELPATFVPIGCTNLKRDMQRLLEKEGVSFDEIETYGTPRRLAVYVKGLAMGKAAIKEERRGPAVAASYDAEGNPKPAAIGFFRSLGMDAPKLSDAKIGIVKDTEYLFGEKTTEGRATAEILAENLASLIGNLEFPKKMHWADLKITFARPLQWVVALFGKDVVPFTVANLNSGRTSFGHRQLDPAPFEIATAKDYLETLRAHKVMASIEERRASIEKQLDSVDGSIVAKEWVIPQVLHLVEWPQVTVASFDEGFLKAPKEVLISEMVVHQKYFPVANEEGSLKNRFVITADNTPSDEIRKGNQKVLSARLSDGVFLYEQDLKTPLEQFNEKLTHMTFQKGWGSVFDKVKRIQENAKVLQNLLGLSTSEKVVRASQLCKADLSSAMVYEFPDLQGTMGKYYALHSNEDKEVALAIEEHWMPRGELAPLPKTETGIIVSFADKLDNLICCFSKGLKPTSSSDPYALRRQTLGIIKMMISGKHHLSLKQLFSNCLAHYSEVPADELLDFFTNRIKTVFQDYGFSKDEIEASVSGGVQDIYDTFCRVKALHEFRKRGDQFPLLYEVYKRAKGQINQSDKKVFSHELLQEDAEIALVESLNSIQGKLDKSIEKHEYDAAYELIARLQPRLATLFDEVRILADDPKIQENRIALLQRVFSLFGRLIDFSKIQVV